MPSSFDRARAFNRFKEAQRHIDIAKAWLRMAASKRLRGLETEATRAESYAQSHTRIAKTLNEMEPT